MSDMSATIRNATPARKRLLVRNHTTRAIIPAGRMKSSISAISMIMTMPIMRRRINSPRSNSPLGNPGMAIIGKFGPSV